MSRIPVLTTERLRLRAPRATDFPAFAAFFASPRSRHEGGPLSRPASWKEFAAALKQWKLRGYGAWSIENRSDRNYLGEVGLFHPEHYPEAEIGWTLMERAEGKGYAFEAACAARSYAYEVLGLGTLVSYIAPENDRSIRLAERLGAVLDTEAPRPEGGCSVYRHPGPEILQ